MNASKGSQTGLADLPVCRGDENPPPAEAMIQCQYQLQRPQAHDVLERWAVGLGVTSPSLALMLAAASSPLHRVPEPYAHLCPREPGRSRATSRPMSGLAHAAGRQGSAESSSASRVRARRDLT